jgi:molecular chaperone DnaJ
VKLKDYYKVLGLTESASADEIKKAFRDLAKKFHPDANPGNKAAEEKFKEISEAYEALSNPDKKSKYDQLKRAQSQGYDFSGMNRGGASHGGESGGTYSGNADMGDIFGDIFGNTGKRGATGGGFSDFSDLFDMFFEGGRPKQQQKYREEEQGSGDDVTVRIEIPFDLSMKGGETIIKVPRESVCSRCGGTGGEPGSSAETCPKCGGRGKIQFSQGGFIINKTCPNCAGSGRSYSRDCSLCHGEGIEKEIKQIRIKVPAGVSDGTKIKIHEQGDTGPGKSGRGDLYVIFKVKQSEEFERKGDDLYFKARINIAQAMVGGNIKIPAHDGEINVKIPAGTSEGAMLKVKGHGVKNMKTGRSGDLYAVIGVDIPKADNDKERKLVEELAKLKGMKL